MSYIGNTSTTQSFVPAIDYFSGNGSTTAFTLSRPVASVAQVQAVIENVAQNPSTAFTVSGNTITFTSAPPTGSNNIYIYYTSPVTNVIAPSQGTVYPSSLSTGGMYWDTSSNVGIGTNNTGYRLNATKNGSASVVAAVSDTQSTVRSECNSVAVDLNTAGSIGEVRTATNHPLVFSTNSTERMRINTSGYVTAPYQPSFRAGLNGTAVSVAQGGTWKFTTTSGNSKHNVGNCYNTSTSIFTAPVAGRYYFHMQVITEGNANNTSREDLITLRVNGVLVGYSERRAFYVTGSTGGSGYYTDNVTAILTLAANDTVYGTNASVAATQHANDNYSIFEGYLIG